MDITQYVPWDKSWIIRMAVLDLLNGGTGTADFLSGEERLGDDLLALGRAVDAWRNGDDIDVGESGTLYRFLVFASWKLGLNKRFIRRGTLADRPVSADASIVGLPQAELLKLDNRTSQWASAAALLGSTERIINPPCKLAVTYEAVGHWHQRHGQGLPWEPRKDKTILRQAESYRRMLAGKAPGFLPGQAEDFCFAFMFGLMTAAEGEARWPSLRGHESDRIEEVGYTLREMSQGLPVSSRDHRIVQAAAMRGQVRGIPVAFIAPDAVNKSWPQFWEFLEACRQQ